MKNSVLKNFTKFAKNNCVRVSFLIKLQTSGLQIYLKRDSDTGVFLCILQIFKNTFFVEHLQAIASQNIQDLQETRKKEKYKTFIIFL